MPVDGERPCPGCGSAKRRWLGGKGGHALVRCGACATVFATVSPLEDAAQDYDAYYHHANLTVPDFVDRRLDEIVAGMARFRRTGRWLDVGCGAGSLVRAAARAGWEVEGIEIAPAPVAILTSEGYDVSLGDVTALPLKPGTYDVVTLIEVLEHLPDPLAVLRRAHALLRAGGALYLTTPHARGLSGRLLGLHWSTLAPPEHLQLFSLSGLRAATLRAGFARCDLRTRGANPYELLAALRRRADPQAAPVTGTERVQAAYRLNAALLSRRTGAGAKRALNATLNALGLGDSLTCHAVRAESAPPCDHGVTTPRGGGTSPA